ncbi:sortase domain-containing protein [Microcella frigidaquae]|uniref:LPXTG-site transpeptidase (Sortase) family protein n=1 Tax=Microcella frigidaquae TaxID=424758 RepID=A0A840X4Q5_9MICO|nr:LPXTG-site transpeptidase (sortase) family protein [Microcella frigidaquae]NHN45352.1 class E sortase [Microcella frigidaquae]
MTSTPSVSWRDRVRVSVTATRTRMRSAVAGALDAVARESSDLRPATASRAIPALTPLDRARFGSTALLLVGSILLGFAAYLVIASPVTFLRDQALLREELRFELANSTAPVSQFESTGELLTPGQPVALLEIDAIDLSTVIVEGTDARALQSGPGHRRDTVMPGQVGASVIFGRQAAFGGPFSRLSELDEGDRIVVTTGQGRFVFTVAGVRTGQEALPDRPASDSTLTLVTATGIPYFAEDVLRVDAVLAGNAAEAGARAFGYSALPRDELAMASRFSTGSEVAIWALLLLAAVAAMPVMRRAWGRWQAWAVGVPTTVFLGFLLFRDLSTLLPNLT